MANNNDPVILSQEPNSVRVNIQDPNKPQQGGKMIKKQQKRPFLDRVIAAFCGPDVDRTNVGKYILEERLEPIGLRMINNGIQSGLKRVGDASQVMLFGKVISSSNGPTDYTSFSQPNQVGKPGGYRVMDQVDVFAFTDKRKAMECLGYLQGRIKQYGSASVVDYYEWINTNLPGVDIPLDYNMTYRGWVDLSNVYISTDPNGFIINFPRPIGLKGK